MVRSDVAASTPVLNGKWDAVVALSGPAWPRCATSRGHRGPPRGTGGWPGTRRRWLPVRAVRAARGRARPGGRRRLVPHTVTYHPTCHSMRLLQARGGRSDCCGGGRHRASGPARGVGLVRVRRDVLPENSETRRPQWWRTNLVTSSPPRGEVLTGGDHSCLVDMAEPCPGSMAACAPLTWRSSRQHRDDPQVPLVLPVVRGEAAPQEGEAMSSFLGMPSACPPA